MGYKLKLTKERRREACVHEAGHAIICALGGDSVYRVAVAPEGAENWEVEGSNGEALKDLFGVCSREGMPPIIRPFIRFDDADGTYKADKKGFMRCVETLPVFVLALMRRDLRAELCTLMAGPIAEQIYRGDDVFIDMEIGEPFDDIKRAEGASMLLPFRNEMDHAEAVTEAAVRNPEVWLMVLRLADELERVGYIEEGIEAFLPAPVPDWPTSPRARKERPFVVRPMKT